MCHTVTRDWRTSELRPLFPPGARLKDKETNLDDDGLLGAYPSWLMVATIDYNLRYHTGALISMMIRVLHLLLLVSLLLAPQTTDGWSLPVTRREVFGTMATTTTASMLIGAWGLPVLAEENASKNTTHLVTEEEHERQALLRRMQERRQLMEASRSSNSRQSYLDLSRQRAALYNTTSRAVSCPPNIPCL